MTQRLKIKDVFQALLIIYLRISIINTNDVKLLPSKVHIYDTYTTVSCVYIRLPSYLRRYIRIHACLLG